MSMYSPIPVGSIRLLKPVWHNRGIEADRKSLAFELIPFPLSRLGSSQCRYTAVSYAWGTAPPSREVVIGEKPFAVRQSLWSCLFYLTKYQRKQANYLWQYLWVDAICINQADVQERAEQVKHMGRVFAGACEVSAWLGLQHHPGFLVWREEGIDTTEVGNWTPNDNVVELAQRPYWTRMWIVQELILARRVRFHVGDSSFDLSTLRHILELRRESEDMQDFERIMAHVPQRYSDHEGSSLEELLRDFGACQCQDPRDKVFALLGLLSKQEKDSLSQYLPDYSLTHEAVVVIALNHLRAFRHRSPGNKIMTSSELFDVLEVPRSKKFREWLRRASKSVDLRDDELQARDLNVVGIREGMTWDDEDSDIDSESGHVPPRACRCPMDCFLTLLRPSRRSERDEANIFNDMVASFLGQVQEAQNQYAI